MQAGGLTQVAPDVFFLPASPGYRFALFMPPSGPVRGKILYVPPFAEEMNKSRRMAALAVRAFAQAGFGVMQIDLFGCGDSSGDFEEATWLHWKSDIELARSWIDDRIDGGLHIWALRLGALLALDCIAGGNARAASLMLWQPVLNGEAFMSQFLRIATAADAFREGNRRVSTQTLRAQLNRGETIEVAGYSLTSQLVTAIDALKLSELIPAGIPVHWFDIRNEAAHEIPVATERALNSWRDAGTPVRHERIMGAPFWTTQEIATVPQLIEASVAALAGM